MKRWVNSGAKIRCTMMVVGSLLLLNFGVQAEAFNRLVCSGNLDVRLKGPQLKKPKVASLVMTKFSITRKDALELELSVDGVVIGQLFPWDHVVWQPVNPMPNSVKDVKLKTDDAAFLSLSVFDIVHAKDRSMECNFRFEK